MSGRRFLAARMDASGRIGLPAGPERVPWWSFTKTVLAAAALRLVAQGACGLDDPIDERGRTLRQLLQHRAGLPDYGGLGSYHDAVRRGERPWPVDEMLERLRDDRPDLGQGHGWRYSNVGYLHVRRWIERQADRDLGDALRKLVLDPLRLASVALASDPGDLDGTAWGNAGRYHPGWVYHGLLVGSPGDAVRLLHGLTAGSLLPPGLFGQMAAPHPLGDGALPGRPWQSTGYGLGLMTGRMAGVGRALGHSGAGPGSVCAVYRFPEAPVPCTVAVFAEAHDEGAAELEAVRLAGGD